MTAYLDVITLNPKTSQINIRKYRMGNQKWTIQKNWQYRVHKTKKTKHHYAQAKTTHILK
jgi:hypothetical protein